MLARDERANLGKQSSKGRLGAGITRRRFLGTLTAGTALVALSGSLGCEPSSLTRASAAPQGPGQARSFRSRPDLRPPAIKVNTNLPGTAPGHIFVSPKKGPGEEAPTQDAPLIVDASGEPVWFHPLQDAEADAFTFEVQTYRGERVLTWWEGHHTGYGQGEYVILDGSYREIARVRAGNGYEGDHHEFLITPEDTALITIYHKVPMDLSGVGGPVDGSVLYGIVQEIDIRSGEVLFEWHSLEHVGLEESLYEPPPDLRAPFDYFHINSIDPMPGGCLIISARRTCAVYKVSRRTGEVVWRLGGEKSDFEMGYGTRTDWQHDARRQEDGNVLVGWGSEPVISEFDHDGRLLFSAAYPAEGESYRAFRLPWSGQPTDNPAIVAELGREDEITIYASWNGATEVTTWQVLAGSAPDQLEPLASAPCQGFETVI